MSKIASNMKIRLFTLLALLSTGHLHAAEKVEIFNDKDLTGWKIQDAAYWSVKDGVLTGQSDEKKQNSILWTEEQFKDFTLEFDFRFSGDIDSGVFLRHVDDQIQIGISRSLQRDLTGSPYIGSKGKYTAEAEGVSELLKDGEWNRMKITVKGKGYTVEINGKQVLDYQSDTLIGEGPVGFQVHSGVVMKIEFKDISLEKLD